MALQLGPYDFDERRGGILGPLCYVDSMNPVTSYNSSSTMVSAIPPASYMVPQGQESYNFASSSSSSSSSSSQSASHQTMVDHSFGLGPVPGVSPEYMALGYMPSPPSLSGSSTRSSTGSTIDGNEGTPPTVLQDASPPVEPFDTLGLTPSMDMTVNSTAIDSRIPMEAMNPCSDPSINQPVNHAPTLPIVNPIDQPTVDGRAIHSSINDSCAAPAPTTSTNEPSTPQSGDGDLDFNGRKHRRWKNRKYKCSHCDLSFLDADLDLYAQHVEHVEKNTENGILLTRRKYKCAHPSCPWHKIGFLRKLEAQKHFVRKHGVPQFECRFWVPEGEKFPGCGVCTTRWHADSGNRSRHEHAIHANGLKMLEANSPSANSKRK
uniref:ARAD1C23584p n=1 Tax=Blastobotrys adeninivorans TaxID=409370 RepID=A0A060T293_BLAAD